MCQLKEKNSIKILCAINSPVVLKAILPEGLGNAQIRHEAPFFEAGVRLSEY